MAINPNSFQTWLDNPVSKIHMYGNVFVSKALVCADGFQVSVQPKHTGHPSPRGDLSSAHACNLFEVGYPSQDCIILDISRDEIASFVSADDVQKEINIHGGLVGFYHHIDESDIDGNPLVKIAFKLDGHQREVFLKEMEEWVTWSPSNKENNNLDDFKPDDDGFYSIIVSDVDSLGFIPKVFKKVFTQISNTKFVYLMTKYQMEEFDYSIIDPRMVDIVKEFNQIPDVITRFCCSGHTVEEIFKENSDAGDWALLTASSPHIIFTYDRGFDLDWFIEMFQLWSELLSEELQLLLRPKLSLFSLMSKELIQAGFENTHYHAIEIQFDFRRASQHPAEEAYVIEALNRAWFDLIAFLKR